MPNDGAKDARVARPAGSTLEANFAALVAAHARWRGDDRMLDFQGRSMTFGQYHRRGMRTAAALAARGVGVGDRVAFLDKNSPEFLEVLAGVALLRAVLVPVNVRLAPVELGYVINHSEASVLIVGADLLATVEQVRADLRHVRTVIVLGGIADTPHLDYERWLSAADPGALPDHGSPEADDTLLQMYTSGTTGRPKGALLTNAALFTEIGRVVEPWRLGEVSVNLVVMPLHHIAGTYDFLIGYAVGARTLLLREMDPAQIARAVPEQGVTHMFLVPAALAQIVDLAVAEHVDWSSLTTLLYAGSPISDALLLRAMSVIGCGFIQVYGLTEAPNISYLAPEFHDPVNRPGLLRSCGRPYPYSDLRVVGADGADRPAGEVGELWVRSVQTMAGYWNDPDATAAVRSADGWFRTGDAVFLDRDGFLFLHDRIKDVVISGGENVYPAEVENVLAAHPNVAEAAVIGIPDERWGEVPLAIVVAREGTVTTTEDIIAFCRRRLAAFKCPADVQFVDTLPRNASGKVLKHQLREAHWTNHGRFVN
jgi:long-chain acyl-CoA synthetase